MDSLSSKNISVLVPENAPRSGGFAHMVEIILRESHPGIAIQHVPLSELSPTNAGDVVVTLDSIEYGGQIHIGTQFIVDKIRERVTSIPVVLYNMTGTSKEGFEKYPGREKTAILHKGPALSDALRSVLGLPQ